MNAAWRRRSERLRPVGEAPEHESEPEPERDPREAALREAVARLPEALRTVLYLRYLEDTPVREVAALLGVSEKTVEGRLYRARERLRVTLGSEAKDR